MAVICNKKYEIGNISRLFTRENLVGVFTIAIMLTLFACSSGPVKNQQPTMAGEAVTDSTENSNNEESQSKETPTIPMNLDEPDFSQYAYFYLDQNRSQYGLKDPYSQLSVVRENVDNQRNKHVTFQQVYKGVPVWGQEITVNLDHANRIMNVDAKKVKSVKIDRVKPAISKEKAAELVMQDKKWSKKGWGVEHTKLYIVSRDSHYELAYRLTLGDGFPRDYVFINAQNGKLIQLNN
jgi:Zn-dependent metalloprotease